MSPVTRPKSRPRIGSDHARGGKEVCVQIGLGFSSRLSLRHVGATVLRVAGVILERQGTWVKVMVACWT